MICVLPVSPKDTREVANLLSWIRKLGGCKAHDALIVADADVDWGSSIEILESAGQAFKTVKLTTNDKPTVGWPLGPNSLFREACKWIANAGNGAHWFWCESDCIPLKTGWLDKLDEAYKALPPGKPYLGAVVRSSQPLMNLPDVYFAGCGVYPSYALNQIGGYCNGALAWDMAMAKLVVPLAVNTPLIHQFWGKKDLAPTFVLQKSEQTPVNAFTLDDIHPDAVVFHRNKDGTLMRMLGRKLFPGQPVSVSEFIVVHPFHNGDAPLLIKSLKWQAEMGVPRRHDCLIAHDAATIKQFVRDVHVAALNVYKNVHVYACRKPSTNRWPQAANEMFSQIARYMKHAMNRSWLWAEADFIPISPNWIDVLQDEYHNCGKPIMGSVVSGMGHVNGTAIYPANFVDVSPRSLNCGSNAFDTAMAPDTMGITHDAGHLMCHVWGIINGHPMPSAGTAASFKSVEDLDRWVLKTAVTFHRCKDGSIIEMLRKRNDANRNHDSVVGSGHALAGALP